LSGAFNVLKQEYPSLPLWQEDPVFNGNSGERIPRWCFSNGEKLYNKSEPISRNLLRELHWLYWEEMILTRLKWQLILFGIIALVAERLSCQWSLMEHAFGITI